MHSEKKLVVSHAPFWHDGTALATRHYNIMLAALLPIIAGFLTYGVPVIGVVALSVSTAIFWELLFNKISKRPISIGDGNAALIGLLFAMLLPATVPWWLVVTGTFMCIVIGKQIFGGLGANPFNPALVGIAILTLSWPNFLDFNFMLSNYDTGFAMAYPLASAKYFGPQAVAAFTPGALLMGKQAGGLGATFGLGIIIGGLYLIVRGYIRWEIVASFLAGVFVTALAFSLKDPSHYAGPTVHLLAGYTLLGAFFLATEDSSSPVNFLPMLIYGAGCGIMTVLIRNIGIYIDGVVLAILLMNLFHPLIDKIRPKAMGKVA